MVARRGVEAASGVFGGEQNDVEAKLRIGPCNTCKGLLHTGVVADKELAATLGDSDGNTGRGLGRTGDVADSEVAATRGASGTTLWQAR